LYPVWIWQQNRKQIFFTRSIRSYRSQTLCLSSLPFPGPTPYCILPWPPQLTPVVSGSSAMDKWIKKITPKRPKRSHVHENPATFSKPITASTSLQPQPQGASAPWQPTPLQPTSSALPPASSPSTPPTIEQSTTDLLFNATRQGLTLVKETLDGVPVPGLKGAIGGLLCILEMLDVSCHFLSAFTPLAAHEVCFKSNEVRTSKRR